MVLKPSGLCRSSGALFPICEYFYKYIAPSGAQLLKKISFYKYVAPSGAIGAPDISLQISAGTLQFQDFA